MKIPADLLKLQEKKSLTYREAKISNVEYDLN